MNSDEQPHLLIVTLRSSHDSCYSHIPLLGVLGFSQGATTAALLCTKKVSEMVDFRPKVKPSLYVSPNYPSPGEAGDSIHLNILHPSVCIAC